MAKYLITGGAGFIGSHLADALVELGHEVVILDNFGSGKATNLCGPAASAKVIEGDILDLARFDDAIGPVDGIYHLAALISGYDSLADPDSYVRNNIEGTQRVIEFAGRVGAKRILFASSSTIYGNQSRSAIDEECPPSPLTTYALTKLAGEHLLRLYASIHGYDHCSLRLFNVYGPRQGVDHPYANVTCKFSHAAARGLDVELYGDGEQARDFVYVDDVVQAFIQVRAAAAAPIYNVGTGVATSINALLRSLEEISGKPIGRAQHPEWPNDLRSIRADIGRFAGEFGDRPPTALDEGLRHTVSSFLSE